MATVLEKIQELTTIVTNAIEDGDASRVPARTVPANLIKVATGTYTETLPIIVPEKTCVQGDELRSTAVGPSAGTTDITDATYSIGTLGRLEEIIGDVVKGLDVTETSGNIETQSRDFPFADTLEETSLKRLVRTIQHNIDFRLNSNALRLISDPTGGSNNASDSGYANARKLINENKKFFQEQVLAFLQANYSTVRYSKTKCRQDIGYIVDALFYDLTYGGFTQSINAGLAYFEGNSGVIGTAEKSATLAAYSYLSTIMRAVSLNQVVATNQDIVGQFRDTAGSTTAADAITTGVGYIRTIIQSGLDSAPNITVTSITGTDTLVTSTAHGLSIGDNFIPRSTTNGLTTDVKYWVVNVPSSTQFKVAASRGASAITITNGTGLSLIGDVIFNPGDTWVPGTLPAAFNALDLEQENLVTATTNYISANFPSLTYDTDKCERDTRLILEAIGFDFMFNSNYQTLKAAHAYLRSTASDVYDLGQKKATRDAYENLKTVILADTATYLSSDATAAARVQTLFTLLDDVIFSGSNEGDNCATDKRNRDYAYLQIERNRDYIIAELNAYIADTYSDTATATTASDDTITISDTSWLKRNTAIRFTGTTLGGLSTGTTYYVQNVVSSTKFTVATTRFATTALALTDDTGSMAVTLFYNTTLCSRDTSAYLDAIKYDLKFSGNNTDFDEDQTGNYKSLLAARLYANSVLGSLEEDMYYLRDATGIRNQTTQGLTGDLGPVNEFGTSRPTAGAYCSLDPGWGPDDYRAWILTRSPYVQGVTTFGTAAIGQKIDGNLHNGGNDSIVSNDFTQVISDGIGAWITNNGRAELVSVFSYYAHIGYLAENGGRIRGTNGNCSYGDFGAVAEGVDDRETPITAVVDNEDFEATVGSAITDGDQFLALEYDNAGQDYTEVTFTLTGGGAGTGVDDIIETRDDAVFEVRLLDLGNDSSGQFGGDGYLTNSNTAQGGTTSSITLAATDGELSTAYIGMKILIDGGTGVGQFGIVSSYNSGTKVANIVRESDGQSGWDHLVPGTAIVALDASSTYVAEPALAFDSPGFTALEVDLGATATWTDVAYGDTTEFFNSLSADTYSGSGTGATFDVTRNGSKYIVSLENAGTGYSRLETLTFLGSNLGGDDTTNDIVVTITAINSVTGAIIDFEFTGAGRGGLFVAGQNTGNTGAYSYDGETWAASTISMGGDGVGAIAHGLIDDGTSDLKIGRFVAISETSGNAAAYSDDGINWIGSTLPASADWKGVVFGNGRFVAIADDSTTVAISLDGIAWDITGTLPATGFNAVTYGHGSFHAVKNGDTDAYAYSDDGGETWTADDMPASANWVSIAWGNNKLIAVADDSNTGAISADGGTTWSSMTVGSPDSSDPSGLKKIRYGQGLFMATAALAPDIEEYTYVVKSQDGLYWEWEGVPTAGNSITLGGFNAIAFGNPQRTGYWVIAANASSDIGVRIRTGATAKARAFVAEEKIFAIRITEPGSGYDVTPNITITDPNNTFELPFSVRTANGVLGQPNYTNRGSQFTSGSATVTGDGVADFFQPGGFVAVKRLSERPQAGANVVFDSIPNKTFKLVNVLTFLGQNDGSYTAFLQVSPELTIAEAPPHEDGITTRLLYSQCRLTGHDFLDIGTGNFDETNYPNDPLNDPIPANETVESAGGRVFYTSTDQDGNFRVGDLFSIEQSTGVATLNADAFNISGLQELNLGNVTLGGGSATVTEFSTDPFFTADSNNIVPTQRAIKAYIASQIGGGGASLNVNSVTAGSIFINSNEITTTGGQSIQMNATFEFRGGVTGYPLAWNYFFT